MVDAFALVYLVGAGLVGLIAFHDAPIRLVRAYREGSVVEDVGYHVANVASVVVVAAWLGAVLLGYDARLLPGEGASLIWARGVGLALAWPGFLFAVWARVTLARAFVPTGAVMEGQSVETRGPYALVRHPFYVGLMWAIAFGVLALDSVATLGAVLVLVPLVHVIATGEERHLAAELGDAYEIYAARVPRYIPRFPSKGSG